MKRFVTHPLFSFVFAVTCCAGAAASFAATWTGVDLSSGGTLSENTTVTLQNNETIKISNVITGSGGTLTIAGPGTFVLNAQNTYTKATYVTGGTATQAATLKLSQQFTLKANEGIHLAEYSVLDLAASNALSYISSGIMNEITMAGNDTIQLSAANSHANLPSIVISGTNNLIQAKNGPSTLANFFLAGSITLNENAAASIDAEVLVSRAPSASVTSGGETQSGIFNIGNGATLTVGTSLAGKTCEIRTWDAANQDAAFVKRGAGKMIVNGTIDLKRAGSTFAMEAGTLEVTTLMMPGVGKMTGGTLKASKIQATNGFTVSNGSLVVQSLGVGSKPMVISGGTHTLTNADIWSSGTLEMAGGTTTVTSLTGNGTILVSGGTCNVTGTASFGNLLVTSGKFSSSVPLTLRLDAAYVACTGSMEVRNGTVTLNSTLALPGTLKVSGGSVTANGVISGDGSLQVSGGELVLKAGYNTYTGSTTVSGGGTLELAASFARNTGTIAVDGGTLKFSASNAIGYNNGGIAAITLSNSGVLYNSGTGNHVNLGNIVISGTGNEIKADGNGSTFGNYFFGGQIQLNDGASAVINLAKATIRTSINGITKDGECLGGIFNIGTGAVLTANITTIRNLDSDNSVPRILKRGAGSMTINGAVTESGSIVIEAGTLNLNGAAHTYTGGTTVQNGGVLGTGNGDGEIGMLTLPGSITFDAGGRLLVDLSGDNSDVFTFSDLILKDGALIELDWAGGEEDEYAESYAFLTANSIRDGFGNAVTSLSNYLTGPMSGMYTPILQNNVWTLARNDTIPEPASWILLVLGMSLLTGLKFRKDQK